MIDYNYSYRQFFDDLRGLEYSSNIQIDEVWLKESCDRFFGEYYYDKFKKYAQILDEKILKADVLSIKNKFDENNVELTDVYKVMMYTNFDRINSDFNIRYNGFLTHRGGDVNYLLVNILRTLLYDTNSIRTAVETEYVTDDKYKCCNLKYSEVEQFINEYKFMYKDLLTNYDLERFTELFKPGIVLRYGYDYYDTRRQYFSIKQMDDQFKRILKEFESKYKIVYMDYNKDYDTTAYEVKIFI